MFKGINSAVWLVLAGLAHGQLITTVKTNGYSSFIGRAAFSDFARSTGTNGETIWLSLEIKSPIDWNALIVSWNATPPAGSYLKVDARAISPGHATKFYSMGHWTPDNKAFLRTSV